MFNKIRTIGKVSQAAKEPIKAAAKKIKEVFKSSNKDQATKYRKKALQMTKDATAKVGKDAKAAESRIGKDAAQKIGRDTKSKMIKDFLRYNRDLKAKGGRAGYKLGKKVEKKNGKTPFGMLSVKAGIDKNPNPTQADRIAGAKMKNKKKVI